MGKFVKGDIVVLNFPFSNLSGSKHCPALVVANLDGDDIILCQITSSSKTDKHSVRLEASDFISGSLSVESVVRPNKIFTADESIVLYAACRISQEKTNAIIKSIFGILSDSPVMIQNEFTATGLVFNEDGQILMIKHKKLGKWLPPGGHVDENELPCETVAREVLEETGITVQVLSSAPKLDLSDKTAKELPLPLRIIYADVEGTGLHNHIDLLYLCRAINVDTVSQDDEIDGIGWFSPKEAMELDTYEDVIKSIETALGLWHGL